MKLTARAGVAGLVVALTAGLAAPIAAAGPATPERRAAYQPTLQANTAKIVAGKRLILSGKVRPATKGGAVVVQKRLAGSPKWVLEARLTMSASGAYTYSDRPNAAGVRHYRVVVPKAGSVQAGRSKPVTVTVYRWQRLTDVRARKANATYNARSASINAVDYGASLVGVGYTNEGFIDWNLERRCLRLKARFGNSDESDDLATAGITLVADGETRYAHTFALAESEVKSFGLSGVFRLGFHWASTNPNGTVENQSGASATMTQTQVLCAF